MPMKNIERMNNRSDPAPISPKKYMCVLLLAVMLSLGSLPVYAESRALKTHVLVQVELQKKRKRFARRFQNKYLLIV